MVYLLAGPKGTGKTQQMIEQANEAAKKCNGNVVFIKKTHRDTASVTFDIRTIWMISRQSQTLTNISDFYMVCTVLITISSMYLSMVS